MNYTKKSILNVWTMLTIISMPIAIYFIWYTDVNNWLIISIHMPALAGILISQKLYYNYQFEICGVCAIQREFHKREKYPDFADVVCSNFKKQKEVFK